MESHYHQCYLASHPADQPRVARSPTAAAAAADAAEDGEDADDATTRGDQKVLQLEYKTCLLYTSDAADE